MRAGSPLRKGRAPMEQGDGHWLRGLEMVGCVSHRAVVGGGGAGRSNQTRPCAHESLLN